MASMLRARLRNLLLLWLLPLALLPARAQVWTQLGPEGGDVRSLAYDPGHPDRIFLGTSAGQLYLSEDGGRSWSPLARLKDADHYVLDNIVVDPDNPRYLYVAAWDVEREGGDLFRSSDGGRTWEMSRAMHGKSIRALAIANSDTKVVVAGTLDGVFRSSDRGHSWQRISPPDHPEIRNIESVAVDPNDPDVIYVGTWHLPWKTTDGGLTWHWIKRGVIDDSDVFSIVVDPRDTRVVYASACSGIYKSSNGGALFRKIQGIPYSARRTRALQLDPLNPDVVYAGTTEGLWKSPDAGRSWRQLTGKNLIVNDVLVDPRQPQRVLLATDRAGVLASDDAGEIFYASNRGFVHRQVSSLVVDGTTSNRLYASVVNDKEYGGVFFSEDGGDSWQQLNDGLEGREVFVLRQAPEGALLAGTNDGIFLKADRQSAWRPINRIVVEQFGLPEGADRRKMPKGVVRTTEAKLAGRVSDLWLTEEAWFAAAASGLYVSRDHGQTWQGTAYFGYRDFESVRAQGQMVVASSPLGVLVSDNLGQGWYIASLPRRITRVNSATIDGRGRIWVGAREGAYRSDDGGDSFQRVLNGMAATDIRAIEYDPQGRRLLAASGAYKDVFESTDGGATWQRRSAGWNLRSLVWQEGRLLATTTFDGVVAEPPAPAATAAGSATGGGARD